MEIENVIDGTPVGVLAAALEKAVVLVEAPDREALRQVAGGLGSFQSAAEDPRPFVEALGRAITSLSGQAREIVTQTILTTSAESALGSDEYRLPRTLRARRR